MKPMIFCLFFYLDAFAWFFVPTPYRREHAKNIVWLLPGAGFVMLAMAVFVAGQRQR